MGKNNLDYYDYNDYYEKSNHNKLHRERKKKLYNKRKFKRKMRFRRCILLLAAVLSIIGINKCYKSYIKNANEASEIKSNVQTLGNLQNADVSEIQKNIVKNTNQIANKDKLELGRKILDSSSNDYSTYFNDSVFWGDSITEGLTGYKVLKDSEVTAIKGKNVSLAKKDVDLLAVKRPSNLYLLFGMNDLTCFSDLNDFKSAYQSLLDDAKSKLPDTNIYVMSMMYANSKAIARQPELSRSRVEEANGLIKQICSDNGYTYIDITDIYENDPSLYEVDGIHAVGKFYPIWLNKIISYDLGENKVE